MGHTWRKSREDSKVARFAAAAAPDDRGDARKRNREEIEGRKEGGKEPFAGH